MANLELLEKAIAGVSNDARVALGGARASVARMQAQFANAVHIEPEYIVTTRRARVRIGALVETVLNNTRAHAAKRGVHVGQHTVRDCVSSVAAELILRLMESLVDRAVRVSPAGGAVLVTTGLDADEISIQVADEGPSASDAFCETLSFCRAVARAHEGTIEVTNRARRGVIFSVRIPCR